MKNAKSCDKEKKEPMEVDPEKYPWGYSGENITLIIGPQTLASSLKGSQKAVGGREYWRSNL